MQEQSINALIRAVENTDSHLDNRIVRRKAVESLGRLQAKTALPVIQACLSEEDCYLIENAVWAIGEIFIVISLLKLYPKRQRALKTTIPSQEPTN